MGRVIWFFLVCCIANLSAGDRHFPPAQIELKGDSSPIVADCVNVITGAYIASRTDLNIPGAEPVLLQSFYSSDTAARLNISDTWHYSYITNRAVLGYEGSVYSMTIPEPFGKNVNYRSTVGLKYRTGDGRLDGIWAPSQGEFLSRASLLDEGMTNTAHGKVSGCTNLKNQSCHYANRTAEVTLCNGGKRIFREEANRSFCPLVLRIDEEYKPNGNRIFYHYENHALNSISVFDATGTRKYGDLILDGDAKKRTIIASDGKSVQFHLRKNQGKSFVTKIVRSGGIEESFDYAFDKMTKHTLPDERFKLIEYYHPGANYVDGQTIHVKRPEKGASCAGFVKCLKAPVGHDETPIITHNFLYSFVYGGKDALTIRDGSYVTVRDANHHQTVYHLVDGKRLYAIERFTGSDKKSYTSYSLEKFFWGKRENGQQCDLISKAFHGSDGVIRSCLHFEYDDSHNVIAEHILGNLSGEADGSIVLNNDGVPIHNTCECHTILSAYSQDKFHLCTSKSYPNGKRVEYHYKEGTNLLTEQITFDGSKVIAREVTEYDAFNVPCKITKQDGSLATHVQRIFTRQNAPAVGLPERIYDYYVEGDTGKEILLKSTRNRYNKLGLITRQDIYDANDNFCYALRWYYDEMGNVISEQDAAENMIERRYDANGNKTFEKGPSSDYYMTYTYDRANRLISESRWSSDGKGVLTQTYRYDYCGNRIASTDHSGNTTQYIYDELNRLIETILPSGLRIRKAYDLAGNVTSVVDVGGKITTTKYNIRGQPTEITYPDSTTEVFVYYVNGALKSHTSKDGIKICYERDVLDQITKTETYNRNGELASVTHTVYDGTLRISETDSEGIVTTFKYDGCGRVVLTERLGQKQIFEYDTLGRLHKIVEGDIRTTVRLYDNHNRVVEERVESLDKTLLHKVAYTYDAEGRRVEEITFGTEGAAVTSTIYNWQGKPSKIIDPFGHETHISYSYGSELTITTVDPLGNQLIQAQDALGNVVLTTRKDSLGQIISNSAQSYNLNGQLIEQVDTVINFDRSISLQKTLWRYDAAGRVIERIDAVGTSLERHTYVSYNQWGQKVADVLADGCELNYFYDALGRLCHVWSSDNTVDYEYTYDAMGNLIQVDDHIHGLKTLREYDAFHRLTREVLANGLAFEYSYDSLGRIKQFMLPDRSAVYYDYDCLYMRKVNRVDARGHIKYSHVYNDYDLSGRLLSAASFCPNGEMKYGWDKLGRRVRFKGPHFEELITSEGFDASGRLVHKTFSDYAGREECYYRYDALYQLTDEKGASNHTYGSDSLFNRRRKDHQYCEVDSLNRLCRQGDKVFEYDVRGNRISQGDIAYSYDALGRLIKVADATSVYEYIYDNFNRRILKTSTSYGFKTQVRYLYQGSLEIGSVDDNHKLLEFRMLGTEESNARIGTAVAMEIDNDIYVPVHDHSDNVVSLLSAGSGNPVEMYRFSVFGEEKMYQPGTFFGVYENSHPINPWRFGGKRHDAETNLLIFEGSHYDPEIGRRLSQIVSLSLQ